MAGITGIELLWWWTAWHLGIAPAARVATYVGIASLGLVAAMLLRLAVRKGPTAAPWPSVLLGTLLSGIAASAFLPLKYAIPHEVPFWLDRPIALAERSLFGGDPWQLLDRVIGWAAVPIDWLYGCWLPTQSLVLFLVILARPSAAKSRALIAYSLCWFLLGAVVAVFLSSAGPLFFDRLNGGNAFATLGATLEHRGAWIAIAESNRMWASFEGSDPGLVAGISAVPSIHVAISLWMLLAARSMAPRATLPALAYFTVVWVGSVQLGWHYVSDGLIGAIGMIALWFVATPLERALRAGRN